MTSDVSGQQFPLPVGGPTAVHAPGPNGAGRRTPRRSSALRTQRDGLRLVLSLLIIVALSQVHRFLGVPAAVRPALLLAAGALLLAILNPAQLNRRALTRTWPPKVMAGLGLLGFASIPFSISIGGSTAFMLESYLRTLLVGFLVILAIRHVRDLYTFVLAVVLSCAYLGVLAVFVVGVGKGQALVYTSYDPNDIGLVLMVGLPLALALVQSATSWGVRLVGGLAILVAPATIAISGSRGGFLGILAVGVALLVLLKGISVGKRVAFVAVAALALVIAAPAGYWDDMRTITDPHDYNLHSPTGRKAVWTRGIEYMLSNPLTGIGIGSFPRAEGHFSTQAVQRHETGRGGVKWSAAHNSFLQPAAELGVGGLILFSILVFGGMISMLRLRKRLPRWWARGDPQHRFLYHMALYLPVSFVAFAVTGFFLSFAYIEPIYLLAAFVTGTHVSVAVKAREGQASGPGRPFPSRGGKRPAPRPFVSGA